MDKTRIEDTINKGIEVMTKITTAPNSMTTGEIKVLCITIGLFIIIHNKDPKVPIRLKVEFKQKCETKNIKKFKIIVVILR